MAEPALVIVDMQYDYFPGGAMELTGMEGASLHAAKLLEGWRSSARPVFHVRHISIHQGATFFLPDTRGSVIHPSVDPRKDEHVFIKHFPNSFLATELEKALRELSVKQLVICGAMSHMCIDATVRAAFDLGFACTVAQDACATRDLAFRGATVPAATVHAAFMAALGSVYANIVDTDEVIASQENA